MPPKHAEQDQIDAKWPGKKKKKKKKNSESRRVGRSVIIVNMSIKETENCLFNIISNFIQNVYLQSWLPPLVKILPLIRFSLER